MLPSLDPPAKNVLRVATFNVALNRKTEGELAADLRAGDAQAAKIATIIQCVSPDILLVNELDYDATTAELFLERYLRPRQPGAPESQERSLQYFYAAPVNTGVDSGMDLNLNGRLADSDDAWGYGAFPGQYGMAVYSRFPIDTGKVRTFQKFLWSQMPGALRPQVVDKATGKTSYFHLDDVWQRLRLSSKSHWDIPIDIGGERLHILAAHPTPPVFDGPEDRNGCRNHDEIRLLHDYISEGASGSYLVDDEGGRGPLPENAHFVILGDLNADPWDGDGRHEGIRKLLDHPRVARGTAPTSRGGVEATEKTGDANLKHQGDPAHDTGDFNDKGPGNLRIDYALPSANCKILASGVYWPDSTESATGSEWVQASDHRLVWVDIQLH